MNKVIGIELLPEEYHSEEFSEAISSFNKVLSLNIMRVSDALGLFISLEKKDSSIISLYFSDVSELEISNVTIPEFETTVLYIEDISMRQMEGINWEVRNHEDFTFYFMCKSIEIKSHILPNSSSDVVAKIDK